jgi:hypothetical protein
MKTFLPLFGVVLFFSACCKAYCIKDPQLTVSFQRFKARDVDTVYLFRYNPGGTQYADSSASLRPNDAQDTTFSYLNMELTPGSDWEIRIPAVNRQYRITGIQTETGDCNCSSGNYNIVKSFTVNGRQQQGSLLFAE